MEVGRLVARFVYPYTSEQAVDLPRSRESTPVNSRASSTQARFVVRGG